MALEREKKKTKRVKEKKRKKKLCLMLFFFNFIYLKKNKKCNIDEKKHNLVTKNKIYNFYIYFRRKFPVRKFNINFLRNFIKIQFGILTCYRITTELGQLHQNLGKKIKLVGV